MSNVIEFLEWMGQDASWRNGHPEDVEVAIASSSLTPPYKAALLAPDARDLEELLGAGSGLCCLVHNPDDDEDEEEEEEEEDDDKDEEIRGAVRQSC
jgi:hypothetical protein